MKKLLSSLSEVEFVKENGNADLIGYGALSQVRKVLHKATGKFFALKEMNLLDIHPNDILNINREVKNHMKLNHPNVIHLFDHFTSQNKHLYLLLEYAENNNLFHFIHKHKQLDERTVHKFFFQTLQAIEYIHQRNIMHRDLKPENLLLDKNINIKLCDFGWCAEYSDFEKRQTFCGTSEYMAPEIFGNKKQDFKIDIWSLGILLFEMYHKKAPFTGRSPKDIYNCILKRRIAYSPSLCPLARDLIEKLLMIEPSQRPTIEQIYDHPYFKKFPFFKINTIDPKAVSNKAFRHSYIGNDNIKSTTLSAQPRLDPAPPFEAKLLQANPPKILANDNSRPLTAQSPQIPPKQPFQPSSSLHPSHPSPHQPSQPSPYAPKPQQDLDRTAQPAPPFHNFIKSLDLPEDPQKPRLNHLYGPNPPNHLRPDHPPNLPHNPFQGSPLQTYGQSALRPQTELTRNTEEKRDSRGEHPALNKPPNLGSTYNIYSQGNAGGQLSNSMTYEPNQNSQSIFTSNFKPTTYQDIHQNRQAVQVIGVL